VRIEVLAFRRWCLAQSVGVETIAGLLDLGPATLAAWARGWRSHQLRPRPRGRPPEEADRDTRNLVIAALHLLGPGVGLPTLQLFFPRLARRALEDLVRRYRHVYRKRRRQFLSVLRWTTAGAVWAIDFSEAPLPIDGVYRYLLVVRDLASGAQLLAQPSEDPTGEVVRGALQALFLQHGAPLVLKSDNGSHFVNDEVDRLLARWGTLPLRSPPRTPRYNGACEAGIGGLKARAHHESARHGRAGEWTCDDIEVARCLANATARPWGSAAPVPDDAWSRQSPDQRDAHRPAFVAAVARLRQDAVAEQDGAEMPASSASIERIAISRALVAHGLLHVTRRRVSLPIKQRQTSEIS